MLTGCLGSGLVSPSISRLVDVLIHISGSFETVFMVLDGLDECSEEVQVEVHVAMQKLCALGESTFKFLVVCREQAKLAAALQNSSVPKIILDNVNTSQDITAYVKLSVEANIGSHSLIRDDQNLRELVESTFLRKAQGM